MLTLQPNMAKALPGIEAAHHDADLARGAVITSANDSTHMQGSLHYRGLAVDLRTRDLAHIAISLLQAKLRGRLNGEESLDQPYQIIVEADHLHVEWDPH